MGGGVGDHEVRGGRVHIERILTDSGASYRSHACRDALAEHEIRHKRTRLFHPLTNGKAERFIQTVAGHRAAWSREALASNEVGGPSQMLTA